MSLQLAQLLIRMHGISDCCGEACSRGRCGGQDGEVEPSQIAVEVFCGDAAEASEEILELAVATVHRLNVQGAAHPFPGRRVERLVAHAERGRARGIRAMGVGEEQDVFRDCGFECVPQGVAGFSRIPRRPETTLVADAAVNSFAHSGAETVRDRARSSARAAMPKRRPERSGRRSRAGRRGSSALGRGFWPGLRPPRVVRRSAIRRLKALKLKACAWEDANRR